MGLLTPRPIPGRVYILALAGPGRKDECISTLGMWRWVGNTEIGSGVLNLQTASTDTMSGMTQTHGGSDL